MSKWKPVAINPDEADDFELEPDTIEADVPSKNTPQQQQPQPQEGTSSQQQGTASSFFNFSNFVRPNIDLSNSFNPILKNEQVREHSFTGGDTLDEPVWKTLERDLRSIGNRLLSVIWPASLSRLAKVQQHNLLIAARNSGINVGIDFDRLGQDLEQDLGNTALDDSELKKLDWDLWGPLMFTLAFSVILGVMSPGSSSSEVFSGVFAIVWSTLAIIAINIQLLGGTISFFNALSTTGYALFPLLLLAVVSIFVRWSFIRFVFYVILVAWGIYAATVNLKVHGVLPGRVFLAIYPVGLVYATLGWLCVIT
jgi:hypothetical protein